MAAKSDPRILKTRAAIRSAFIRLMQEKEYDAITVTDISEYAQINRKTFYAHYETRDELFAQMIREMFSDLFSTFMYAKPMPDDGIDEERLLRDVTRFFEKIEAYREDINTLIGRKTMHMVFEIADEIIREKLNTIHAPSDDLEGMVMSALFASRIKTFFFNGLDWWLDQTDYTVEQAALIYSRMMCMSTASIFRYGQM